MSTIPVPVRPLFLGARPWLTVRPIARSWSWQRLAALVIGLVALAGILTTGLVGSSIADVPAAAPVSIVVQSGDTVWELAREHAPAGASVQDYASRVVIHNGVTATALQPGSVLTLPQD